jgi:hypothetical protein
VAVGATVAAGDRAGETLAGARPVDEHATSATERRRNKGERRIVRIDGA